MKFARITFYIAFVWGLLVLTPLLFMFNLISRQDPPPITHPAFYYGFASVGLAFQFIFLAIAGDPIRYRLMMLPSILEKSGYFIALTALYLEQRLHPQDLAFAAIDGLFAILFLVSFLRTPKIA
jgi:hypothetical protein